MLGSVALPLVFGACVTAARSGGGTTAPAREFALRIVSYNIKHGRGEDQQVDLARTANVLRPLAADIIALQEVDERVQRSGAADEAATLGRALGMEHAFGAFMDYQGGRYGLAILSRHPILDAREIRLPDGNEPRVALAARIRLTDGQDVMAINVHFDWVEDDAFRFAQATALTQVLDTLSLPYVLLGDFNDLPPSRTLALFRARATEVAKPADAHFTFPSSGPVKEIDYVFVSPASAWRPGEARVIDERMASDHRPVLALATLLGGRSAP